MKSSADLRLLAEKCLSSNILSTNEIHGGLLNETYKIETDKGNFILKKHLENPKVLASFRKELNKFDKGQYHQTEVGNDL